MATPVANVNSLNDTFEQWLTKTNTLCALFSNNALTAFANSTGHHTTGNTQLHGYFSADYINVGVLRGGANIESTANISLVSNVISSPAVLIVGSNVAIAEQLRGSNSTGGSANLLITTNTTVNAHYLVVDHDFRVVINAAANVICANSSIRGGNNTVSNTLNVISEANFTANIINQFTTTANVFINASNAYINTTTTTVQGNVFIDSGASATSWINVRSANTLLNIDKATLAVNTVTGTANVITLNTTNTSITGAGFLVISYPTANIVGGKLNVVSNTQFFGDVQGNVAFTGNTITTITVGKTASVNSFVANVVTANLNISNINFQTANITGTITQTTLTATGVDLTGTNLKFNYTTANIAATTANLQIASVVGNANVVLNGNASFTGTEFKYNVTSANLNATTANVSGGKINFISNSQFFGEVQGNVNLTGTKVTFNGALLEISSFCDVITSANNDLGLGTAGVATLIHTMNSSYSSAKLTVQTKSGTSSQISEIVLSANGTDSHLTVYGTVSTPAAANLAVFSTNTSSGTARLFITPVANNMSVKLVAHQIK